MKNPMLSELALALTGGVALRNANVCLVQRLPTRRNVCLVRERITREIPLESGPITGTVAGLRVE
jgi:hypothetical protein